VFRIRAINKHPFHLVSLSPWPLCSAISSLLFVSGLVLSFSGFGASLLLLGTVLLFLSCFLWWSSVIYESTLTGYHTLRVQSALRLGILLFIVSEVFFFLA